MDLISTMLSFLTQPSISGPTGILSLLILLHMQRSNTNGWNSQLIANVLHTASAMFRVRPEMTKEQIISFALSYADLTATAQKRKLSPLDEAAVSHGVGLMYDTTAAAFRKAPLIP
jgi:hypothetical protein